MIIGGLQKTSLVDYPGKVSALVYTQGCNFRCPYCHNPELIGGRRTDDGRRIFEKGILRFLKSRRGKLDAVVVTGGEPTIQVDLLNFIKKIKDLDFTVGLYTNGSRPEVLNKLISQELINYFSMDIKSQLAGSRYQLAAGVKVDIDKIKKSIQLIRESGIDYDFKTTVVPGLATLEDVEKLVVDIQGAKKFVIQQFVNSGKMLDNKYKRVKPYGREEMEELRKRIAKYFEECEVRG